MRWVACQHPMERGPFGPASTPHRSTTAAGVAAVSTVVRRNGTVLVVLTCPSSAPAHCKGSVSVLGASVLGPAGRSGTANAAAFGRATYTVQPGKRIVLTLHLSKAALKLLAHRHALRVTLVLRGQHGRVTQRRTMTLRAPKP